MTLPPEQAGFYTRPARMTDAGAAADLLRDAPSDIPGIFEMRGLWFVAGKVLRDFASLNNEEMLPWDVWGPMSPAGAGLTPDKLALFDRLAALTLDADRRFAELRALYNGDATLRVPAEVFNADRRRIEPVR